MCDQTAPPQSAGSSPSYDQSAANQRIAAACPRRAQHGNRALSGAIVEREIPAVFVRDNAVRLLLHNPDFTSASRMADAINAQWPAVATPVDAATVSVLLPPNYRGRDVAFIADLGQIESTADTLARIVINERTGTIVANSRIKISHCAVSHGNLTINIASSQDVSQPTPLSQGGTTAVTARTDTSVTESKTGLVTLPELPTVEKVASALNALGVTPRDMMAIFQAMKQAGALQAELLIR